MNTEMYGNEVRYLHYNTENTHRYSIGRHIYEKIDENVTNEYAKIALDAIIMKFNYAPWPEVKKRKLNVAALIPQSQLDMKWGYQHEDRMKGGEPFLNQEYLMQQNLTNINLYEANQKDDFHVNISRIFRDVFPKV